MPVISKKYFRASSPSVFEHYIRHSVREIRNYIIPMPAPPAGAAGCGSLMVDTTDSVVSSVDATLVAF